jgi:membrane protease YdiL (CAAX protease family)
MSFDTGTPDSAACDLPRESQPETLAAESSGIAKKPRVWTVASVVIFTFIFYLVTSVTAAIVAAVLTTNEPIQTPADLERALVNGVANPSVLLSSAGFAGLSLLIAVLIATSLSPVPWSQRLNLRRPQIDGRGWMVAMIGTISFGQILIGLDGLGFIPDSPTLGAIGSVISSLQGPWLVIAFLIIGVMPGITEELFFRGYLQTRLVARWGSIIGVLITAFLFGLIHMDLVQGLFAAAMGLYLGYVTILARSIVPAMVCHAVNNSTSFLLSRFSQGIESPESVPGNLVLITAGVLSAVFASWYVQRSSGRVHRDLLAREVNAPVATDLVR